MQCVGDAAPDIGPEDKADALGVRGNGVNRALHNRHDLLPFPLNHREHRIRLVGQAAGTHYPDRFGYQVTDVFAGPDGCHAESYKHDP